MKRIVFGFSDEFKLPAELMRQLTEQFKNDFQFYVGGLESKPEIFENADAFIGWPSDQMIRAMTNLSWLQLPSAGADHFAHHPLLKDQVTVTNASGVFGALGAEHILALILAFVRQLPLYVRQTEKHIWNVEPEVRQLEGATVAIIGLGDIGLEAAVRLKAFGSRILAVKRTVTKKPDCVDDVFDMSGLSTVLKGSDFVVNVLPLTTETEGLFDETKFSFMKEGAIFINVGRGATVDEQALIRALRSGRLGGAGLDVTSREPLPEDSELWHFPNVLITSHSLGAGPGKLNKRAELIRKNLENFRDGKPLINVVDRKLGY